MPGTGHFQRCSLMSREPVVRQTWRQQESTNIIPCAVEGEGAVLPSRAVEPSCTELGDCPQVTALPWAPAPRQ